MQEELSLPPTELKRELGLFDSTMIVIGSMIGSGIFIVTADIARHVGAPGYILLIWLITGLITTFAALSYGELAGMMPKAGGQYIYLQEAYGSLTGFLFGWSVFMVIQTGVIAAVAIAFAKFTGVIFPWFSTENVLFTIFNFKFNTQQLLAIASIVLLTYINLRGVANAKIVQLVFTVAKIVALIGLIILGIYIGFNSEVFKSNLVDFWKPYKIIEEAGKITMQSISGTTLLSAMGLAMVGSLFSSDAWNNITYTAGEVKDPKRNIPLSLFYGTLTVTVLYILANVAYLCLLPVQGSNVGASAIERGIMFATSDRVGTAAAEQIFGNPAIVIMAFLIMVSTFGCNNGLILSGARVYYAMAKDGLFYKKAGTLNKNNVPAFALIIQAIWTCVLCLSGTYGKLLDYCTFASLAFYILTIIAVFILRVKEPNIPRPYKAFGYPVIPAVYILVGSAICINLLIYKSDTSWAGVGIVLLGIPIYYLNKRKKSKIVKEKI